MGDAVKKGGEYKDGELELILSLVPTEKNIEYLKKCLPGRSKSSIIIVYRIAHGIKMKSSLAQKRKIKAAKAAIGWAKGV